MVVLVGVTAKETRTGGPTINGADAVKSPEVAVIPAAPTPVLLATPLLPINATDGVSELQFADEVTSWVEPSE